MFKKNILIKTGTRTEQHIDPTSKKVVEVEVPILETKTIEVDDTELVNLKTPISTVARLDEIESALVELAAIIGGE